MVYTVYIDEVFAVNMAMDLMVLMAVNQVLCYRAGAAQIVRGAALGAAWACVTAIFPQMPLTFKAAGTYGAAGAAMAVAAFKVKGIKEISRAAAGIYLSAVILGGAMMVFEEQLRPGGIFFPLACGFKVLGIPDLSGALMLLGGTASVFGAVCWLRGLTASLLQRKALCRVTLRQGSRMYVAAGLIDTGKPAEGAGKRQAGSCSCSGSDRSRIAQGTGSDLYTLPQCGRRRVPSGSDIR